MMTYRDVRALSLNRLRAAESDWRDVHRLLDDRSETARHDLRSKVEEGEWQGEAADAGHRSINAICEQLNGAARLSESVAALLSSVIDDFARYQIDLENLADAAPLNGLRVDAEGRVRAAQRTDSEGDGPRPEQADPDQRHAAEAEEAAREWQQRIDGIVANANETDSTADLALRAALGDDDVKRFTSDPPLIRDDDDIEGVAAHGEATRVVELAQLDRDLTLTEAAEVSRLLRDLSDEEEFADHIVDELGVEGLLDLEDELMPHWVHLPLFGIETPGSKGVADVLATATRVPDGLADVPPENPEFQEWQKTPEGQRWQEITDQTRQLGNGSDRPDGYHRLISLMERADQPYSAAYLDAITGDLITAAKEEPHGDITGVDGAEIESTVLDRTLGVASENPDAAAVILDPERDRWDFLIQRAEDHLSPLNGFPRTYDSPGFGNALEAAATGRPAGEDPSDQWPPPSETNARVGQAVMDYVLEKPEDSNDPRGAPPFMVPQFGTITAQYIPDINQAIDDHPNFPTHENTIDVNRKQAETILTEAAQDATSFNTVMASQQGYAMVAADYAINGDSVDDENERPDLLENMSTSGGHVIGVLAHGHAMSEYEQEIDPSIDQMHKTADYLGVTITDTATLKIPGVSTATADAAKALNEAIFSAKNDENHENASEAADKVIEVSQAEVKNFYQHATMEAMNETSVNETGKDNWAGNAGTQANTGFQRGVNTMDKLVFGKDN